MHFDGTHCCPTCTRPVNVEDYGESLQSDGRLIVYLYCDGCSRGVERLYERRGGTPAGGGFWSFLLESVHSTKSPKALAKFLNNLKASRRADSEYDAPDDVDAPAMMEADAA